jgi:Ca2+-binding RTX toxin-like protein
MAKSVLRFPRIDFDYNEIGDLIQDAVFNGTFVAATNRKVVLQGIEGGKIVFKGDFKVVNGAVAGGKVSGYTAWVGGEKVMKAKGLSFAFAELDQAISDAQADNGSSAHAFFLLLTVDRVIGSKTDDLMLGIAPLLKGRGGDDMIISSFGDKKVLGGNGDDVIVAGLGDDDLFGGRGLDTFAFTSPEDGVDRLHDFKARERIALDDGGFAALGPGVDVAEFVLGKEALTGDHHLIYHRPSGRLWWDPDGAGGSGKILLAKLIESPKLSVANFYVDDFT